MDSTHVFGHGDYEHQNFKSVVDKSKLKEKLHELEDICIRHHGGFFLRQTNYNGYSEMAVYLVGNVLVSNTISPDGKVEANLMYQHGQPNKPLLADLKKSITGEEHGDLVNVT